MHLCERKKSLTVFLKLILYLKLQTSIFGRFGILMLRVPTGWMGLQLIVILMQNVKRFDT